MITAPHMIEALELKGIFWIPRESRIPHGWRSLRCADNPQALLCLIPLDPDWRVDLEPVDLL
jgi:hypothetical protein